MQTIRRVALALSVLASSGPFQPSRADETSPSKLLGNWEGKLKVGVTPLRLVVRVTPGEAGALKATLDSPDQGANGIPIASAKLDGKEVNLDVKAIRGKYKGTLNDAGDTIEGRWNQGPVDLPLTLARVNKPTELKRPQTPKAPFPYKTIEVSYPGGGEGVTLAGTLTIPEGTGPFPVVLLITGSGPQDRDESIFGHKPFLVIADDLTRAGVAVLRVDDRGVGGSTGDSKTATTKEFVEDVAAGVEFLKSRPEVDPAKIGLLGHSEGGIIAPAVAARSKDVAFLVLLAGTGMNGQEILIRQGKLILRAMGGAEDAINRNSETQKKLFDALNSKDSDEQIRKLMADILGAEHARFSDDEKKAVGDVDAFSKAQIDAVMSPWMRYFLVYNPLPVLAKVTCPVLALNGEKDLQVPPENLDEIANALKAAGNMRVTTRVFPGLNHLFQPCKTGAISEYATIEETISPEVLKTIREWVAQHAGG